MGSDSPYLREAAIIAIYHYLNDESPEEVAEFKSKLNLIYEDSTAFVGVQERIEDIMDSL